MNDGLLLLVTVRSTWPVCPWTTVNVPPVRFEVRENVPEFTVSAIDGVTECVIWLRLPVVALIVMLPAVDPAVMVAVVVTAAPFGVTEEGLKVQVVPLGPVQEKLTVPVKLCTGVMVMVEVPLCDGQSVSVLAEEVPLKSGGVFRATAKAFRSSEPRPLARSNPADAL